MVLRIVMNIVFARSSRKSIRQAGQHIYIYTYAHIYIYGFTHRNEYRVCEEFKKIYKAGGAAQHGAVVVDSVFDVLIQQQERERKESEKRKLTSSLRLPVSVKQRIQEAESRKRPQDEGQESVAKLVRFDPELPAKEPSPKQPRTEMYSATFASEPFLQSKQWFWQCETTTSAR